MGLVLFCFPQMGATKKTFLFPLFKGKTVF
jgi:hypothetical protein